jgi:hypothetical protein
MYIYMFIYICIYIYVYIYICVYICGPDANATTAVHHPSYIS